MAASTSSGLTLPCRYTAWARGSSFLFGVVHQKKIPWLLTIPIFAIWSVTTSAKRTHYQYQMVLPLASTTIYTSLRTCQPRNAPIAAFTNWGGTNSPANLFPSTLFPRHRLRRIRWPMISSPATPATCEIQAPYNSQNPNMPVTNGPNYRVFN